MKKRRRVSIDIPIAEPGMNSPPYRGRVVKVITLACTADYYDCNGGFCRRMLLEYRRGRWYVNEPPYALHRAERCRRPGAHPHRWRPLRRRRT